LRWTPYPAAQQYRVFTGTNVSNPFAETLVGTIAGNSWSANSGGSSRFYQLHVTPLASNVLLTATVLNRLAYGPTPDDLERIVTGPNPIGPDAYIAEQLAPETISETLDDEDSTGTNWVYATATGTADNIRFYIYLNQAGTAYVDDVKLVRGTVPEAGTNLLLNGDFETTLTGPWVLTANFANSVATTEVAHSGSRSLKVVAGDAGSGVGNAVYQTFATSVSSTQQYTLSYWYLADRAADPATTLTVRLSGSLTESVVSLHPVSAGSIYPLLTNRTARLADLRAWHCLHAIDSKRQLLEVLTQFFENHFVTQHAKSVDYFDRYFDDFAEMDRLAANLDFREVSRWRNATLNPRCTFYDLLKISAESPAMIIYLDTVDSRGSSGSIANENYARELLELFTFGVDNGYDQNDIVSMSKAWTGWSVDIVDATNIFNPFAPRSTTLLPGATNTARSNLVGVWTFKFKDANHNTGSKTIFPGKTVPARFGSPWAGRSYQLSIPSRSSTNGIQDGYDVLTHLANLPFTQEYICVKLCRLFVHDDFAHGYDFRDPNLSPEGQLVKQCMLAWETNSPKGQLRPVLNTIFNSQLFRSHGGSLQKIKTPLEFAISAIRALRSKNSDGSFTATTDGYSISGRSRTASSSPLNRMGTMMLFDRADPDGYPESGPPWISAGSLAERVRFIQTLCMTWNDTAKEDNISGGNRNWVDPVALLGKKLPASALTNAGTVTDYLLGILYPAEGKANLDLYRSAAIGFLNTADDGVTVSSFSSLAPGTTYDTRVRGVVSMLLSFQRFQEQ
jgi:uncharacterized protein (DUF1800 family)